MIIAIDIGNTNIHVGIFEKKKMLTSFLIGADSSRSGDEYAVTIDSLVSSEGVSLTELEGAIMTVLYHNYSEKL